MQNYVLASSDIQASRLVGRVGALAVALGVGAVWFSGGVASADSSTDSGTSSPSAHSAGSTSAGPRAARQARSGAGAAAAAKSTVAARKSRPAAAATKRAAAAITPAADTADATPSVGSAVAVQTATAPAASTPGEASAPVAQDSAPVVTTVALPEVAPATGEVTALAAASSAAADSSANGNPADSADAPLSWLVAAFTRRAGAAAAAVDPTYTQSLCTQQSASCTYVLGPSGVPTPSSAYVDTVMKYYVLPNSVQPETSAQIVSTPEGAYPVTGIKVLPLTISAEQGQAIVENTINYLQPGPQPGNVPVTLFGYSQSAVITSLMQRELGTPGYLSGLNRDLLTFVTVGQEMAPDGGWFARYPGLNLPSLGEYFFGSTPENSFPTTNYTLEYDGFADSPRYPGNFLSSLNAAMGILLVHVNYASPNYFANTYGTTLGSFDPVMGTEGPGVACNEGSSSCIKLPTTSDTQNYYFIKTPHLPLLAPVRAIPFIGKPLAALVEPVLKVLVDLGYGDAAHGFKSGGQPDANVPAPFAIFPPVSPIEVVTKLVAGVGQGIKDFVHELTNGGGGGGGIKLPTLKQILAIATTWVKEFPARLNAAGSALYATLLATADFANSVVTSLPAYNVQLAIQALKEGFTGGGIIKGFINAIGLPVSADIGLASVIGVVQVAVWLEGILAAVTGCGPAAPQAGMCLVPSLA